MVQDIVARIVSFKGYTRKLKYLPYHEIRVHKTQKSITESHITCLLVLCLIIKAIWKRKQCKDARRKYERI